MAITVQRSAWRTRGLSATLSRMPTKKSGATVPLPGATGVGDFSSLPLIAFLVFALGRPYRGIVQDPRSISAARLPISIHPG